MHTYSKVISVAIVAATFVISLPLHGAETYKSYYTSLADKDCKKIYSSDDDPDAPIDSFDYSCLGRDGYSVMHAGGDMRSWLEVKGNGIDLSTMSFETHFKGQFAHVSGKKLEWRYKGKRLVALIYRVTGQDPDDPDKKLSSLFVVRIEPKKTCFLSIAKTNEEARELADGAKACN